VLAASGIRSVVLCNTMIYGKDAATRLRLSTAATELRTALQTAQRKAQRDKAGGQNTRVHGRLIASDWCQDECSVLCLF
jgi:hypothetical protein